MVFAGGCVWIRGLLGLAAPTNPGWLSVACWVPLQLGPPRVTFLAQSAFAIGNVAEVTSTRGISIRLTVGRFFYLTKRVYIRGIA